MRPSLKRALCPPTWPQVRSHQLAAVTLSTSLLGDRVRNYETGSSIYDEERGRGLDDRLGGIDIVTNTRLRLRLVSPCQRLCLPPPLVLMTAATESLHTRRINGIE